MEKLKKNVEQLQQIDAISRQYSITLMKWEKINGSSLANRKYDILADSALDTHRAKYM